MGTRKGLGFTRANLEDTYEANIDENLAFGTTNQKLTHEQKLTQENIQKSRSKALNEKMAQKKKSLADKKASGKGGKKMSKVGFSDLDADGNDIDSRKFGTVASRVQPEDTIQESKKTAPKLRGVDGGSESDALKSDQSNDPGRIGTEPLGMDTPAIGFFKGDTRKDGQSVKDDDSKDGQSNGDSGMDIGSRSD